MMATSYIPFIFPLQIIDGKYCINGGLVTKTNEILNGIEGYLH
jgi:hypothetical protein